MILYCLTMRQGSKNTQHVKTVDNLLELNQIQISLDGTLIAVT